MLVSHLYHVLRLWQSVLSMCLCLFMLFAAYVALGVCLPQYYPGWFQRTELDLYFRYILLFKV